MHAEHKPFVPAERSIPEFTPIPVVMGVLLGILFGASSLYLALKVGMTVSASIPVAVLSITLFKGFSKVEPGDVHFNLQQQQQAGAAAVAPPPAGRSVPPDRKRIAKKGAKCGVVPLRLKDVAEQLAFIADELLLSELQQAGFEAIGPTDISAMLGFEKTKEAVGCDDASCMAELGNALGVDYLAAGNISTLDASIVVTLKLIDVKATRVLARTSRVSDGGQRGLPAVLAESVQELVSRSGL